MLRRNKLTPACEPCRKSKIKCDHGLPKCQKCHSRGRSEECQYHPAPMTKSRDDRSIRRSVGHVTPRHRLRTDESPVSQSLVQPAVRRSSHAGLGSTSEDSTIRRPLQYLGSTSYASALLEPQDRRYGGLMAARSAFEFVKIFRSPYEAALIEQLRSFPIYERLIKAYCERGIFNIIPSPLILGVLPHIKSHLKRIDEIGIDRVLQDMIRQTALPFEIPNDTTAHSFHELFTKDQLRWEILGFIFALAGTAALSLPTAQLNTILDPNGPDASNIADDMIWASNTVIQICQHNCAINDIYMWVLYQNAILRSDHLGEFSHFVWSRLNEVAGECFAIGLHRQSSPNTPFWLSETRKRLFAAVFKSDKTLATFFGRPPRIQKVYCDIDMPLEIDDNDVMSSPADLGLLLAKLDSNGWNLAEEPKVRQTSGIRMRYQLSALKEDIVEISLGQHVPGAYLINRLYALREKCSSVWDSFPKHLRYDETIWSKYTDAASMMLFITFMEYSSGRFQIERMLCKELGERGATSALLQTSMDVVSALIEVLKYRHDCVEVEKQFIWILLLYGMPAMGVLATELRASALKSRPLPPNISRSELIKKLSIIISCLDWVSVTKTRDYTTCLDINKVLAKILDEALDSPPSTTETAEMMAAETLNGLANGTDLDLSGLNGLVDLPEDFLSWLDSFDLQQTLPVY